ncbi:putative mitochondrial protein, partial [Mucuna pruriens]
MFRKVEINIPLLDAIKQIPKYAKFLKELCVHKRKKMKESVEVGGIVLALTRNEDFTTRAQALPKKYRDPEIFSVPCTIGEYTFANDMLNLGASINVKLTSIYKALNFGDLEPIGMTIQLANRSIVQPLGVLEDVLVQVNEQIFPVDFYMLDMEDKTSKQGSTLILGRPFLMIARTKIDVHARTLSMEFGDTLVQFNIFEAMKHPTKDHFLFGIDLIDELVEEYFQLNSHSEDIDNFAKRTDSIGCLGSISKEEVDYAESREVHNLPNSKDNKNDSADLDFEAELLEVLDQVCKHEKPECSIDTEVQVAETEKLFSTKLATIFTAEDDIRRQIGWKLSDLLGINPSTCMHRILMEEAAKPIKQQQRRMNPTILDVVKKEVTKLLVVSPVQVVLKKSGMTVMKNQHDELVPMRIQNSWRATRKDHFPLPFIDQVLDKSKIDILTSLPNPAFVWEVCSFLGHASFYRRFIKNFSNFALPLSKLLQKDVKFKFDQPCIEAFQELKNRLISTPILQAPNWDLPFFKHPIRH